MVCLNIRSGSIRSMWPSHWSFLARIHFTRLKVLPLLASALTVLPVITLTILELAPFKAEHTSVVSRHASEPYVRILHTLALYSRILKFICNVLLHHMCLILPKRYLALSILMHTSDIWVSPVSYMDPRYLTCHLFCVSFSPHDNNFSATSFSSWLCLSPPSMSLCVACDHDVQSVSYDLLSPGVLRTYCSTQCICSLLPSGSG